MSDSMTEMGVGEHGISWLVHIDISPRDELPAAELLLERLVAEHDASRFGAAPVVVRQQARANHFEIIWVEARCPYSEYRLSAPMRGLRDGLAPNLASPFVVRSCARATPARWPEMASNALIVLSEFELTAGDPTGWPPEFAEYLTAQQACAGHQGYVVLERQGPAAVVELISRWSDEGAFERFVTDQATESQRVGLGPALAAPIEDRRHRVVFGQWTGG